MDIKQLEENLSKIEREIAEEREMLNVLAEEKGISKTEVIDSAREKIRLREQKRKIYFDWLNRLEEYEDCLDREYFQIERDIKDIQEKTRKLHEENQRILSKKSADIFDEIIKRAEKEKKRTGNNPFDI